MESSQNASLENFPRSPSEKINIRRSSVFKRQSIAPLNNDPNEDETQESKKFKVHCDTESFDLSKYIENLKEEDKKWREVYVKRKARVQELIKKERHQDPKQMLDISCLLDSEKAFLSAKPDYEEINKNLFLLHNTATKVTYLNMCAERFLENSTSKLLKDSESFVYRINNLTD